METFKDRLIAEQAELLTRFEKLTVFIHDTDKFNSVETVQRSLLRIQHSAMETYLKCLDERLRYLV